MRGGTSGWFHLTQQFLAWGPRIAFTGSVNWDGEGSYLANSNCNLPFSSIMHKGNKPPVTLGVFVTSSPTEITDIFISYSGGGRNFDLLLTLITISKYGSFCFVC